MIHCPTHGLIFGHSCSRCRGAAQARAEAIYGENLREKFARDERERKEMRAAADREVQRYYARTSPRRGDWMQTASGRQFWPLDPRPEEVHVEDIASHLSKICRYNGACDWHYSVAQHSVYVAHQVPPEHALAALMHDAAEAYTCDIHRPLKVDLHGYAEIEGRVWRAIAARFNLPEVLPDCVHDADNAVLLAEKAQLMRPSPAPWNVPGSPAPIGIAQWQPEQARDAFLSLFRRLAAQRVAHHPV